MMAPPRSKQFPPRAIDGIRQSQAHIRKDIASMRETVLVSRDAIWNAQQSINDADDVLARWLPLRTR
jgi:hypothetical protein